MARIFCGWKSCMLVVACLVIVFVIKHRSDAVWDKRLGGAAATDVLRDKNQTQQHVECSEGKVCSPNNGSGSLRGRRSDEGNASCPSYFKWIRRDLAPWRKTGITLKMVEEAREKASFRLIVLNGRMFIESYRKCFQTRDVFTKWGFAQLLRYYPGMVPDLDLMFNCNDRPVIRRSNYRNTHPPPLFHYCGSDDTFDIAFPDWSFWGWPEVQIPPWEGLFNDIQNGSRQVKWADREPTAYWRGNLDVSHGRQDLLKCNTSKAHDWNARLYRQNWHQESKQGFRSSKLSTQCKHRYKIYIEGNAWSVSLKYIMACDSPTLMITPKFYDFFLRGLIPLRHYWPVTPDMECASIKFAVDWGNNHTAQARAIGQAGRDFIANELKMRDVYNYMLHSLTEYAKLLRYKPSVTARAVEYCSEASTCFAKQSEVPYMKDSMVTHPAASFPCHLDSASSDAKDIKNLVELKSKSIQHVKALEKKAWNPPN